MKPMVIVTAVVNGDFRIGVKMDGPQVPRDPEAQKVKNEIAELGKLLRNSSEDKHADRTE